MSYDTFSREDLIAELNAKQAQNESLNGIVRETSAELGRVRQEKAKIETARMRLATRLETIEQTIQHCPDARFVFNTDEDIEGTLGRIPLDWNLRIPAICAESVMLNALTFEELIDKATLFFAEESNTTKLRVKPEPPRALRVCHHLNSVPWGYASRKCQDCGHIWED